MFKTQNWSDKTKDVIFDIWLFVICMPSILLRLIRGLVKYGVAACRNRTIEFMVYMRNWLYSTMMGRSCLKVLDWLYPITD